MGAEEETSISQYVGGRGVKSARGVLGGKDRDPERENCA